jgi:hypothetical protein
MKNSIILFAMLIFVLSTFEWNPIYAQNYNVAYIYDTDSSNGLSFRSFLNAADYQTSLIKISEISITNFDSFALIIIDSRSGYGGDWGSPQEVQIIQSSNKPIFALGIGGSCFFQQLGISINWLNSWIVSDTMCNFQRCTKIFVEDTTLSVFNTPYNINFPQPPSAPIIQLYNNSSYIGTYKPNLSDSVLYVGREPIDTLHYSIVAEGELYWLWGFENSPAHMTQIGKELFINIVHHLVDVIPGVNNRQQLSDFSFELIQNYPNPFNPSTKIKYQIPELSFVTLKVYDVLGNEIETLVNEEKPTGTYELTLYAEGLPSGVYFYQLRVTDPESSSGQGFVETKKMILLK